MSIKLNEAPKDWTAVRIGEISHIANGQVDPLSVDYSDHIHIGPENIESGTGKLTGLRTAKECGVTSGKYAFDEEALVYSKIRPNLNKVCRPKFAGICSADMYPIWVNSDEILDIDFLFQYMLAPQFVKAAIARSMRTGIPKINRLDLENLELLLPPLGQQKKIAKILSIWDKAISTTEKLLENSQQQKKALMQQLLTGMRRLPGHSKNWQKVTVNQIIDIAYGESPKNIVKENGRFPIIGTGGVIGKTNSRLSDGPAIAIGRKGTIDRPLYLASPFWAIDTTFYCTPIVECDLYWVYLRLCLVHWRKYNEASGVPSLSRNTVSKIPLDIPPYEEQAALAEIFGKAEQEVQNVRESLKGLRAEKKSLMQQLLTGKRRVNVNSEELA